MKKLLDFFLEDTSRELEGIIVARSRNGVQYTTDSGPFRKNDRERWKIMIRRNDKPTTRYACDMRDLFIIKRCPALEPIRISMNPGKIFINEMNLIPKIIQDGFDEMLYRIGVKPQIITINMYGNPKKKQIIAVVHIDRQGKTTKRKAKVTRAKKDKPDIKFAIKYAVTMALENVTTSQMKSRIDKMTIPYGKRTSITFKDLVSQRFYRAFPGTKEEADKFIDQEIQTLSSKYPTVAKW